MDDIPWLDRLSNVVNRRGGYYDADCPLCRGKRKLWVRSQAGTITFGCWKGCNKLEILRAIGCGWKDCWPSGEMPDRPRQEVTAVYQYRDEFGDVLYETVRLEPGYNGRDKTFRQRRPLPGGRFAWGLAEGCYGASRPGGRNLYRCDKGDPAKYDQVEIPKSRLVLYRLPEIVRADRDEILWIVSGEKDADSLHQIGLLATTNVGGEGKSWEDSYSTCCVYRTICIVDDADAVGRRHGDEVTGSLIRHGVRSVRRVQLPGKDATACLNRLRSEGVAEDLLKATFLELAKGVCWKPVTTR